MCSKAASAKGVLKAAGGQSTPERRLVAWLCVWAAVRVIVMSAAFPLFNNVDEVLHFDYVWKCARGELPGPMQRLSPGAAAVAVQYSWPPDYLSTERMIRENSIPPLWTLSKQDYDRIYPGLHGYYCTIKNHETVQPPLYYLIAGGWYRLGEMVGVPDRVLPFWVRFLNVPMIAALVLLAHRLAALAAPDNSFIRLGVPMFVATVPQDLFYGITNGGLGVLLYTVALYALARLWFGGRLGYGSCAAAGLAVGATLVTTYTIVPLLLLSAAVMVTCGFRGWRECRSGGTITRLLVMSACLLLLPCLWAARNFSVFGHLTAVPAFVEHAGWKSLSFAAMWDHPIFSTGGAWRFWSECMSSYFRGELSWHATRLAFAWLDGFCVWSAAICLLATVPRLLRRMNNAAAVDWTSVGLVGASIAMLAAVSVSYDFGSWPWPSRLDPFYTSGRLVFGTIVPFAYLYLIGLESLVNGAASRTKAIRSPRRVAFAILVLICALMAVSDVVLSVPVFAARCNLFHLL
jgi:hypothetical protein